MMKSMHRLAVAGILAMTGSLARAEDAARAVAEPEGFAATIASSWKKLTPDWQARLQPDEVQAICNLYRNKPPADVAAKILAGEKAGVVLPADGQVVGDWKKGKEIANNGRGGQFSDEPGTVNGGNCYACHQLEPKEVSYGTLGPSLTGYGKQRGFSPEAARATYAKIYNAQSVLACSNMPRFGANKVLTEQQIKDAVGFLFDPDSPVNK